MNKQINLKPLPAEAFFFFGLLNKEGFVQQEWDCTEENSLGCGEKAPGQCGTLPPVIARRKSHRQETHHKIPCEQASQRETLIPRKEKSLLPGNSGCGGSESLTRQLRSLSVVAGCSHGAFPEWTAVLNQQRRQKDQE